MLRKRFTLFCSAALFSVVSLAAEPQLDATISDLGHRWAKISYATPDAEKDAAFEALIGSAKQAAQRFPDKAEPLIWQAIVLASAAKTEGGLTALRKVKEARDLLLSAEAIDATAMDGSIYGSLGSLYAKVPGWPIGFGDKKKARAYLEKALAIDAANIDTNFFYADLLADQGEYAKSAEHLKRALAAPARPGREDADAGRRRDASDLLATLKEKHGDQLANN